ncbi:MAG: GNAT family N-acetyltransferase [Bacillota bacterium]
MTFTEMDPGQLNDIRHLFPGLRLEMVLDSIACGNTFGRLWTVDPADPGVLSLLWDGGNNKFYLTAGRQASGSLAALGRLVGGEIREAAHECGVLYFGVCALSAAAEGLAGAAFGGFLTGRRDSLFFRAPAARSVRRGPDPEGISFLPIDQEFLSGAGSVVEAVRREIEWMWPSVEHFLRGGWGTAAVAGDEVLCWCTAEYVGRRLCGIGIETVPEARNRGLGTATAARVVAEAGRRGCSPNWECGVDNPPSIRVAEKLGFQLEERTSFLVGRFE